MWSITLLAATYTDRNHCLGLKFTGPSPSSKVLDILEAASTNNCTLRHAHKTHKCCWLTGNSQTRADMSQKKVLLVVVNYPYQRNPIQPWLKNEPCRSELSSYLICKQTMIIGEEGNQSGVFSECLFGNQKTDVSLESSISLSYESGNGK